MKKINQGTISRSTKGRAIGVNLMRGIMKVQKCINQIKGLNHRSEILIVKEEDNKIGSYRRQESSWR